MRLAVVDRVLAGPDVPVPPRRHDFKLRREGLVGQLEADLIVALAGAAVGDRVGAFEQGNLDLVLGGQRPGH